jgi:integrase
MSTTTTGTTIATLGGVTLSSTGSSFDDALEDARAYAAKSRAPRTLAAYAYQWRVFTTWCAEHNASPLPASPTTLVAYIAHLAPTSPTTTRRAWKPASIALALVAIRAAHQSAGVEPATKHPAVVAVLRGMRRELGTAQRRVAPVTVPELRAMVDALPDGLAATRDRALLVCGMAGALRRSELVALDVGDVAETDEGLVVTVRRSKVDQEAAGAKVPLPRGAHAATCPVRALRAWLDASAITDGAIFCTVDRHGNVGERLAGADAARIVKRTAARAGLDAATFSGHSLRAGLATQAARSGKSDRAIMAQGRWKSRTMVDRYVRDGALFRDCAADGLGL